MDDSDDTLCLFVDAANTQCLPIPTRCYRNSLFPKIM